MQFHGQKGEPQSPIAWKPNSSNLAKIIVRCPVLVAQAYAFSLLPKQPLSHLDLINSAPRPQTPRKQASEKYQETVGYLTMSSDTR